MLGAALLLLVAAAPAPADDHLRRPSSLDEKPRLRESTGREILRIADRLPEVRSERAKFPGSTRSVFLKGATEWQVSYYAKTPPGKPRKEIAQVHVDDRTGAVLELWTGFRVPWTMARGYDGAFGRSVTEWYVWIPLALAFALPFCDPRRLRRLLHLDLLVLSGFSVSLAFFNAAEVEISVPIVAPLLAYLLVRMLLVGLRRSREGPVARDVVPHLLVPLHVLGIGLIFLLGFRIGLNLTDSNVIDVGYAGVVGADRLADGDPLYGHFPDDVEHGDTYGPLVYAAYLPFEQALPWSGTWDSLPAAHAAAITFDLLTVAGLWLLGRRVGGQRLGIALAYAWAACPFTLYTMNTGANDGLVALGVTATLLVATSAPARGALAAATGLTKLAPLALAPVLATHGMAGLPWRRRALRLVAFGVPFVLVAALALGLTVDDARTFWERTIAFQADRGAPFSVWGLYGLDTLQTVVQLAAVALAIVLALVPRRQDVIGLAALCAAVLLALQLAANYWFYLYIAWFLPPLLLVLLSATAGGSARSRPPAPAASTAPALP